ncbi:tyrosine-type recombinase/integrase [Corynebacterium glyciniphilum]|uniref:tyrosine-type recombinase/integrase n=1 Tax=Corynebacterium glyciniphilum TaxID=1404244 RepID=UPI0034D96604
MSPELQYDIQLNKFFYSADMLTARMLTRLGYARDIKAFLNFLQYARGKKDWRAATSDDHLAYLVWRREDADGPRVSPSTWDREVSAVDRFYKWQILGGHALENPIPQRQKRSGSYHQGRQGNAQTPATYSRSARREDVSWLPASSYRQWRDVGLRGYTAHGTPDPEFRGRWAERNAAFSDLMVRTGLRLTEQSSLITPEIPSDSGKHGYERFRLPGAIAKGGSARWIYIPTKVLRSLLGYINIDRRACVKQAQKKGTYDNVATRYIYIAEHRKTSTVHSKRTNEICNARISQLSTEERQRLMVEGPDGWEPASLWLTEAGLPMSSSTWQDIFHTANRRCAKHGVDARAHPHKLRHTFAVLTLEQLQRGHIAELGQLQQHQRTQYTRVFGDPLDWVRQRLGHKSVTTTQEYLHALEELELETRTKLLRDDATDIAESSTATTPIDGGYL